MFPNQEVSTKLRTVKSIVFSSPRVVEETNEWNVCKLIEYSSSSGNFIVQGIYDGQTELYIFMLIVIHSYVLHSKTSTNSSFPIHPKVYKCFVIGYYICNFMHNCLQPSICQSSKLIAYQVVHPRQILNPGQILSTAIGWPQYHGCMIACHKNLQ